MNILVICGHPAPGSLCDALTDAYAEGARSAGHEVNVLKIASLVFDPILHMGYGKKQPLEPDLVKAQQLITAAQHLVFVYPSWWGSLPALLKGFIDRVFLPAYAFSYQEKSPLPIRHLRGKTARIIITMDAPRFWNYLVYRDANIHSMKQATLKFCSIKPVKTTAFCVVRKSDAAKRQTWLAKTRRLGEKGS